MINNQLSDEEKQIFAYHESGHVVFIYLLGYSCKKVYLNDEEGGMTESNTDKTEIYYFIKSNYKIFKWRLALIGLAGHCVEQYYKNPDKKFDINTWYSFDQGQLQINIGRKHGIENVNIFLPYYLNTYCSTIIKTLEYSHIWESIERIANQLLQKENNTLEQNEIEFYLNESGLFNYIKSEDSRKFYEMINSLPC